MQVTVFPIGPLRTNCFILSQTNEAVAIDPGGSPEPVLDFLAQHELTLTHILNTHFHFDHIYGNAALGRATSAQILASPDDAPLLNTELGDGEFMGLPKVEPFSWRPLSPGPTTILGQLCHVLATPGHTLGSLSFYFPETDALFAGDLIFFRSIGRTDFPNSSLPTLIASVREKIFTQPGRTIIYTGHGPATTVSDEQLHNPYLNHFNR
ncbi:hydroxyacylglutathione hydrolase [Desulfovibrionales bacterium]